MLAVLKSLDFDKVSFDVVIVEQDGTSKQKDNDVRQLLAANGYQLVTHIVRNDWFVRDGFQPSERPGLNGKSPQGDASA